MKKIILLLLFVSVFILSGYTQIKILKPKSIIRVYPNSDAGVRIVSLNDYEVVKILGKSTSPYYKIEYRNKIGYVEVTRLIAIEEESKHKNNKAISAEGENLVKLMLGTEIMEFPTKDSHVLKKTTISVVQLLYEINGTGFYKVKYRGDGIGYVHAKNIEGVNVPKNLEIKKLCEKSKRNAKAVLRYMPYKEYDHALSSITKAITNWNLANNLIKIFTERTKVTVSDYAEIIKIGYKHYEDRANIYYIMKDYKEAIADYTKAIELGGDCHKRRTIAYEMAKKAGEDITLYTTTNNNSNVDTSTNFLEEEGHSKKNNEINENSNFINQLPPILAISDISFSESILNAEEMAQLKIKIKNLGPGEAQNVSINLSGYLEGLSFPAKTTLPNIPANGSEESVTIDVKGGINLPTSEAVIKIEVVEPNFKVKIKGKQLKFSTREFRKPELILAKYAVVENQSANPNNQIDINEMVDLKLAVQNIGQGNAEDITINVENNQKGVMLLGVERGGNLTRQNPTFEEIQSGKYKTVIYRYFVNSEFTDEQLKFTINSNERIGEYGFSEIKGFPINKQLEESGYIRTIAQTNDNENEGEVVIEDIPDFVVDVDVDIPINATLKPNTYALIIGNEDYSKYQKGLETEADVPFALNDARVFALYCEKTLGIPKKQIKLLENATSAEINQKLAWISNLAEIEKGKAELIFYYSGHGLPHEKSKEAYLIPVDVAGTNLDFAIKLADVYKKLAENPTKQTTVFLDACFSGGAKNEGLLAMKGIKVKPKEDFISGNLAVFTSSSGDESSNVYDEKQHGYFTYFLLKKLQETKGEASYGNLSNYIMQSVQKEAGLEGKKQTPQINVSPKVESSWKTWKLR